MPLQGLWEYCPDVQLCRQSWSSLLWNIHGLKTWFDWCYNFVSTLTFLFLHSKIGLVITFTFSALHGYFESLRTEKMGTGLSVCMLCPGPTFSRCWQVLKDYFERCEPLELIWMCLSSLLEVAATETPGQSFGESMKATDRRMTAERWNAVALFLTLAALRVLSYLLSRFCTNWPNRECCCCCVLQLLYKVCRTISGGDSEQVARVLDLLPSSSSPDVCKPVSAWDFQVCTPYHLENKKN